MIPIFKTFITTTIVVTGLSSIAKAEISDYSKQMMELFDSAKDKVNLSLLVNSASNKLDCQVIAFDDLGHAKDFVSFEVEKTKYQKLISEAEPAVPAYGPLPAKPAVPAKYTLPADLYLFTHAQLPQFKMPITMKLTQEAKASSKISSVSIKLNKKQTELNMQLGIREVVSIRQNENVIIIKFVGYDRVRDPHNCMHYNNLTDEYECHDSYLPLTTYGYCTK